MNTAKINATVLEVQCSSLLVCDHCTSQEVLVHTSNAHCYCVGDQICITYNGIMTRSIPPQITADCIRKLPVCSCR